MNKVKKVVKKTERKVAKASKKAIFPTIQSDSASNTTVISPEERVKQNIFKLAQGTNKMLSDAYLTGGVTALRKALKHNRQQLTRTLNYMESNPPRKDKSDKFSYAWLLAGVYAGLGICDGYARLLE